MGTHLRVLSKSFQMNTNMTGFKWFFKKLCVLVLWMKVASALEGLIAMIFFRGGCQGGVVLLDGTATYNMVTFWADKTRKPQEELYLIIMAKAQSKSDWPKTPMPLLPKYTPSVRHTQHVISFSQTELKLCTYTRNAWSLISKTLCLLIFHSRYMETIHATVNIS